ncbi:DUF349 domain-containing protein [Limibacter armeniacum]|uniref:DUF349 domain-containing protein n=1 Tax=Limibacter armeniacum TaxID=466084 RepID=UPI002FE6C2A0
MSTHSEEDRKDKAQNVEAGNNSSETKGAVNQENRDSDNKILDMETEKQKVEESVAADKAAEQANVEASASAENADSHEHEDDLEEDRDYSGLSKKELIKESEKLLHHADVVKAEKHARQLKEAMDHIRDEEREVAKAEYVEAQGNDEGFEYHDTDLDVFYTNYKAIRERKKKHFEEMQQMRESNLKKKQAIIDKIKSLIEETDQKGIMAKMKDLQKQWKEIGAVPQMEADELYKTYSALLDMFYDQMSIEFELKELDRKKNYEAKEALCDRAEKLIELENINDAVAQLNLLHDEFRSYGPVPREQQEEIWKRFKEASDKIYDKKREFAEVFKQQLNENMKQKQELCLKVEPFAEFNSDRIKEWNAKTKELLAVQEEWEKVGPLPREVAKEINKQFWGNFKQFFHNKGKFFEELEAQRAENLQKKEALVLRAEELKESADWNATANKLKGLQQEWKGIGPVPEKQRDEVYAKFKAACDYFFERKRNKRKEEDKVFIENLKKKEEICLEIETMAKEGQPFSMEVLEQHIDNFFAIGFVPRRDKDSILEKFLKVAEGYIDSAKVSEEEMEDLKLKFQASVIRHVPNGAKKFRHQESGLRHKITNLENDIALWQNNLAFFAHSKTANQMKEEYQKKIEDAKAEIGKLKDKLKMIQNISDAE